MRTSDLRAVARWALDRVVRRQPKRPAAEPLYIVLRSSRGGLRQTVLATRVQEQEIDPR